ncbi:unnamed protein product, partial [Brachionus calyciflorus]
MKAFLFTIFISYLIEESYTQECDPKFEILNKVTIDMNTFRMMDLKFRIRKNFTYLNLNCLKNSSPYFIENFYFIIENKQTILDESFRIRNFTQNPFYFYSIASVGTITINFQNLNGLSIRTSEIFSPFVLSYNYIGILVNIYDSYFNTKLCFFSNTSGIFNQIDTLSLSYTNKY